MPGGDIVTSDSGFVSRRSGLLVPRGVGGDLVMSSYNRLWDGMGGLAAGGVMLHRDKDTGIWQVPGYGSGWDDYYMRAIVRGDIGNVGIAPTIDPLLSTLVSKLSAMASTWQILLTGRRTPVRKLAEVIARANDSHVGAGDFIADYTGTHLVDNRGAFVSQVPLETVAFEKWAEYGMNAIPQPREGEKESEATYFVLDMTAEALRENRGLWMIDGLDCFPTGNREWPFWYRARRAGEPDAWVLIHRDFGSQIVHPIGPHDRKWRAYGQSPTWRYLNVLGQAIMMQQLDVEAMLNRPPDGIIWGSGLDVPDQLNQMVRAYQQQVKEGGSMYYPGVIWAGSVSESSKIAVVEFSKPPAGYDFNQWRAMKEDYLTATFFVNVSQLVSRFGEGAFTQTQVTDEIQSETGIAHLRKSIEIVLGYVAPPRVTITVNWLSDRQKRYQVETLKSMADGIKQLQEAGMETGEPTFTVAEIRALVEQKAGLDIPTVDAGDSTGDIRDRRIVVDTEPAGDGGTTEEAQSYPLPLLSDVALPDWIRFAHGNLVETAEYGTPGLCLGEKDGLIRVQHDWQRPDAYSSYHPVALRLVRLKGDEEG